MPEQREKRKYVRKTDRVYKKKTGRPTDYKPEYCDDIREALAQGILMYEWAAQKKINITTLHSWRLAHNDFNKAVKEGEELKQYIAEKFTRDSMLNPNLNNVAFVMYCRNFLKLRTKDKDDNQSEFKLSAEQLSELSLEELEVLKNAQEIMKKFQQDG